MGFYPFAARVLLTRAVSCALWLAGTPASTTSPTAVSTPTTTEPTTYAELRDDGERNGISGDVFAAVGGATFGDDLVGGALRTSLVHVGPTHLGLAVAGGTASSTVIVRSERLGTLNGAMARAGGTIGLGAPWDESVVGVALEGGALYGSLTGAVNPVTCAHDLCSSDGRTRVVAVSYASPYAELAATEQLPIKSRLFRPFVREAISTAMDGNASMQAYLSLSVGFAARVW